MSLAEAIQLAAKTREDSYDHEAADKAEGIAVNYEKFYTMSLREAAEFAVQDICLDPKLAVPVYLLLTACWNDALEWADSVLNTGKVICNYIGIDNKVCSLCPHSDEHEEEDDCGAHICFDSDTLIQCAKNEKTEVISWWPPQ